MFIELDGSLINVTQILNFQKDPDTGKVKIEWQDGDTGRSEESLENIKTKLKAAGMFTGLGVFKLKNGDQ